MKHCLNCNGLTRKGDIYCRNCGMKMENSSHYIFLNVISVFMLIGIIFMILLFGITLLG